MNCFGLLRIASDCFGLQHDSMQASPPPQSSLGPRLVALPWPPHLILPWPHLISSLRRDPRAALRAVDGAHRRAGRRVRHADERPPRCLRRHAPLALHLPSLAQHVRGGAPTRRPRPALHLSRVASSAPACSEPSPKPSEPSPKPTECPRRASRPRRWTEIAKISNQHYPELLGTCLIMGTPASASWVFDRVVPLLVDELTLPKVTASARVF